MPQQANQNATSYSPVHSPEGSSLPFHHVTYVITSLETGGAQMMLAKLLSTMGDGKEGADVVSLMDSGALRSRLELLGVKVESLSMRPGRPSARALVRLSRFLRRNQPDIIHAWMYHANLAATCARWLCQTKAIVVWNVRHSLYEMKREPPLTRAVIRVCALMSGTPSAIVYNSYTSAQLHEKIGFDPSRTVVIPNGFDTDTFRPNDTARLRVRRELRIANDDVLIGLIGRYHPMKDHQTFLDAAAILGQDVPDVRFVLSGTNVDDRNHSLTAMILERRLSQAVQLLGERDDIRDLTAALDIASSSSAWGEGFPNVIGEAMSCAVPCVATNVGDSARIIADTGLVVPPREPKALAAAWKDLILRGPEGRQALGLLARQRIGEEYSLADVARKYEDLHQRLILRTGL